MAEMDNVGNERARVISVIVNKPATNTIWSVIQRLVLSVDVYSIWHERNNRRVNQLSRDDVSVSNEIVNTVIMKLMGLKFKYTSNVYRAALIWNIPLVRSDYYRRMVNDLVNE